MALAALLLAHQANGQEAAKKDPAWMLPAAEVDADPKMPTLVQVVGHRWGQEISSHAEIEKF